MPYLAERTMQQAPGDAHGLTKRFRRQESSKLSQTLRTPGLYEYTPTLGTPGLLVHPDSLATRTLWPPGLYECNPTLGDTRTQSTPRLSGNRTLSSPGLLGDQASQETRTLRTLGLSACKDSKNSPDFSGFCDHRFLSMVDTGLRINIT